METDRNKLLVILGVTANHFKEHLSEDQALLYCELLKEFSIEQITAAANYLIMTETFFPRLNKFRELLTRSRSDDITVDAQNAWDEVLDQIESTGYTGIPQFADPIIRMIIPFGKWPAYCLRTRQHDSSIEFMRKDFLEQYKVYARRNAHPVPQALIDLHHSRRYVQQPPGLKRISDLKQEIAALTTKPNTEKPQPVRSPQQSAFPPDSKLTKSEQ